ncbi:MAG: hypothetical protein K0R75_2930, partial [Paenibacillaceae bacterium]|nr:hypothetical protein [Paenibacillaceae bacterium]
MMQNVQENRWKVVWFFALLMAASLVYAMSAKAADYPVDNMTELNSAITNADPGDTITMSDGTWDDVDIVIDGNNGTSASPITLRAETGGGVVLTGSSQLHIGRDYWVVDGLSFKNGALSSGSIIEFREGTGTTYADHSQLTNTQIIDYNPTDHQTSYRWISIYGTYNRVDHGYFSGKDNMGQILAVIRDDASANYAQIDHNFFGNVPVFGDNSAETLRIGTSTYSLSDSSSIVEHNLFYECDGEAEIISVKSGGNKIRYNTILRSKGAITLRHGNGNEVYGNIIVGYDLPDTGGIRVIGEDHKVYNNYVERTTDYGIKLSNGYENSPIAGYRQVINADIYNNTLVDDDIGILIGAEVNNGVDNLGPKDVVIANNIVKSSSGVLIDQETAPINMTYSGNIMYGTTLGISPTPSGITISDPDLELATEIYSLYRPNASTSPAIDAAVSTYTSYITEDMDGQTRPSSKDVGADEITTAAVTQKAQTNVDVGPSWMRTYYNAQGVEDNFVEAEKYTDAAGQFTLQSCTTCSSYGYMDTPKGQGSGGSTSHLEVSSVTASADDGNVPGNTIDGNLTTRWSAEGDGQWIKYDLGASATVDLVKIAFHKGDIRQAIFDIQLSSDGSNWSTVLSNQNASGTGLSLETFDFTNASARYV